MTAEDRFERELVEVMRAAADDFGGPSHDLVRRSIERGRRQRRVHRLRWSGTLVALFCLVGLVVGTASGGVRWFGDDGPAPVAARPGVARGDWTGNLLANLTAALPGNGMVSDGETAFAGTGPMVLRASAFVAARYTNTIGTARVEVTIARLPTTTAWNLPQECGGSLADTGCVVSHGLDGGTLRTFAIPKFQFATYTRPDSTQVQVRAVNPDSPDGTSQPVLSTAEIGQTASSPIWDDIRSALAPPQVQVAGLLAEAVGSAVRDGSVELVVPGTATEVQALVRTGSNSTMIRIRVKPVPENALLLCTRGGCEGGLTVNGLPARYDPYYVEDGVSVQQAVTVLHPDGLELTVESGLVGPADVANDAVQGGSLTREQVEAIATSRVWDA
ncbi:hypothetical protein [Yinghuangia sp. YIM S09857]|uniref:hypothetical protein n=1 Tax=Yinghuangia sp. YIM S09857 TaxID=3436929 RepID=UPI003F52B641